MIRKPKKSLVVDISHLLFRVSSVQKYSNPFARDASPEDLVGLCMHISIQSIFKLYKKFNPDFIVFAFEGGNNWRKVYTAEFKARQAYKGNRVQDPEMAHFYQLIVSFEKTMKAHTSICCLSVDKMEADDSIAGYCQLYAEPDHEITIVSGDKDFTQLTKLPGVRLYDPVAGKYRNMPTDKDYIEDIDYWLFLKCIRGDGGDHVASAYPKVRETKIKQAYINDYDRANFMNTLWTDNSVITQPDGTLLESSVQRRVGDVFNQNVILMDLSKQPEPHRTNLLEGVSAQVTDLGHYSHFHFLRFLEEYKLNKLRDEAMKYVELFANNQRFNKGEAAPKTVLNKEERRAFKEAVEDSGGEIIDMSNGSSPKKVLLEF
jgi:5'-3' exonuclease